MTMRWIDIIQPRKKDQRSGEEIAADILSRIGGEPFEPI